MLFVAFQSLNQIPFGGNAQQMKKWLQKDMPFGANPSIRYTFHSEREIREIEKVN